MACDDKPDRSKLFNSPLYDKMAEGLNLQVVDIDSECKMVHVHRGKGAGELWLRERLKYLSAIKVSHARAITLQGRINRHDTEWLIFISDGEII